MNRASIRNTPYLSRLPEQMVVEGYRHWLAGYDTGLIDSWDLLASKYAETVGDRDAARLVADLSWWIRETRASMRCPLMRFPYGSSRLCRDECLAAGLIAACQHRDAQTRERCLKGMGICPYAGNVVEAANGFADTLGAVGLHLIPVPATIIETLFDCPMRHSLH